MLQDVYVATLATCFHDIDDPRMDRTKFHLLQDILVIAICAVICGAEGPTAIEEYARDKQDWLKTFLTLPNDIPSHDTIGRVIALIDPRQFQSCFLRWVQKVCQLLPGEVVAIDGKTLRHSFDTELDQSPIHIVSAWATSNRLVLGQIKVNDKSNEITAIPELIDALDLTNCIVSIDAMGCQKQIATRIRAKDADYALALKKNQERLFTEVQDLFEHSLSATPMQIRLDYYETIDQAHGRREIRRYWTTDALDGYIARKYGLITTLGRIMDPFVDKIIVCGAFLFLVAERNSGINAWMALIVFSREMFITSLRSFLEQYGRDFSAAWSGKIKMTLQCVAVTASLLSLDADFAAQPQFLMLRDVVLWIAIAVTLYSGVEYTYRAYRLFRA